MPRRERSSRGYLIVAFVIAVLFWVLAQGTDPLEKSYDVPVVFQNVPGHLVITDQNSDVVNIRVQGSRAALRNLEGERLEYLVDVSRANPGQGIYDVEQRPLELPRNAEIVSRSPARLEVKFERRGTKVMKVRPDLAGEPAPGYRVASVEVEPPRITVTGARREVLRLNEAVTEAIDVTGLDAPAEREVGVGLNGENVWVKEPSTVRVKVNIEPEPAEEG